MHLMSCYCHSANKKKKDKQGNEYLSGPKPFINIEHWELFMRTFYALIQVYNDIMWGKIKTNQEKEMNSFQIFNLTRPCNIWYYMFVT